MDLAVWEITVLHKNGVVVDGVQLLPNSASETAALRNVSALKIGPVHVYFSMAIPPAGAPQ